MDLFFNPDAGESYESSVRRIVKMYQARLSPILAAKATCIDSLGRELVQAKARIAELEQRGDRIVELELVNEGNRQRIAELEKRLAEQTTRANNLSRALEREAMKGHPPVDATGKTPGQVGFEAWQKRYASIRRCQAAAWSEETPDCHECEEASAQAVLRAFGGEALRRVRERITRQSESLTHNGALIAEKINREIIDDEFAKLPAAPLTDPQKPTKPAYESIHGEVLFEKITRCLELLGIQTVLPRSVHWGQVGESLKIVLDELVAPEVP